MPEVSRPRVFVDTPEAAKHRERQLDGYYVEMKPANTRRCLYLPGGGEIHDAQGEVQVVAPHDWIVENPDGILTVADAENVVDYWEVVAAEADAAQDFEQCVAYVTEKRKAPPVAEADPAIAQRVNAELDRKYRERHPDEQPQQVVVDPVGAMRAQAEAAREKLSNIIAVSLARELVTPEEAETWLNMGVAPEGVSVSYEAALDSYSVSRAPVAHEGVEVVDTVVEDEGAEPAEPNDGGPDHDGGPDPA